ncbi:hypothetical protein IAT40_004410 [Kwoniella sp. CBS 6097]
MSSPAASVSDGLDLESLDVDSLFRALTNVEKAIPELLLSVKPILAHLVAPAPGSSSSGGGMQYDEETTGMLAREGVERYMTLLDKIQFVLRQTVYYLRETRVSPSTLCPPEAHNIPTPFASTIPPFGSGSSSTIAVGANAGDGEEEQGDGNGPELGLYASRIEARVLSEMGDALRAMRAEATANANADGDGAGKAGDRTTHEKREEGEEGMQVDDDGQRIGESIGPRSG